MRHLGFVRFQTTSPKMRKLLLTVCMARVMKDQLRQVMRARMREVQVPSDEPFKEAIVQLLNSLLSNDKSSDLFWKEELKELLQQKYEVCLSPEELDGDFHLRESVELRCFFALIFSLTGIRLGEDAFAQLLMNYSEFLFVDSDIRRIDSRPKLFAFVYIAEGVSLQLSSANVKS